MTNLFTKLHTVAIPVKDQDRTKATLEDLGFTTTMDKELQPGLRWVELAFSDGEGATLSLVNAGDELPTGMDTGIRLLTTDARAAHKLVSGKGLDVGELLDWESTPLMFSFLDHDGNRFYVSEDG
jgi:catechol 2,3-dioxygenase-like lactoylglutathione lyase family enzyme